MKNYTIEDLCGAAWDSAIMNVINVINSTTESNFTIGDWLKIENIAIKLNIKFDENGNI